MSWTPQHYAPAITGSGATKLAASGVAPIVAAAHGFHTVIPDTAKTAGGALGIAPNSKHARQLRDAAAGGDVLVMPWFDAEQVIQAAQMAARSGSALEPTHTSIQLRPAVPRIDPKSAADKPRMVKYELLAGNLSCLGIHPAMPPEWVTDPAQVFITEGALKGDSVLTAYLRHLGVSDADLALSTPAAARTRLRAILADVPADQRLLIVTFVGVANWHHDPSWNTLRFADRNIYVAFDADVAINPDVWREADRLWSLIERKKGNPILVSLPDIGIAKMGVDDYLATAGDWNALLTHTAPRLPERPARPDEPAPGEWRVEPGKHQVSKWSPAVGPDGRPIPGAGFWEPKVQIAGRVSAIEMMRRADGDEMATGILNPEPDPEAIDARVEFEVTYADLEGTVHTTIVRGTGNTAADPPDQWHRRGAVIPATLTTHPDWPPPMDWLRAIKRNRPGDTEVRTAWGHMGWVPGTDNQMVFICGQQVVGANGLIDPAVAKPGVTDVVLAGASNYGLELAPDPDTERQAWEDVVRAYLNGWRDPADAAIILAAAIRPIAPEKPTRALFLAGAASSGKTWAAKSTLYFWQARPGAFHNAGTGAVNDTAAATESAISRVHIWVVDDLAPSADPVKARADQAKVGGLIRAVANSTPRRRMHADMSAHEVNAARAMLIITAENPLSVSSEMQRVVHVRVRKNGYLAQSRDATDVIERMAKDSMAMTHVAAACIRYIAGRARASSWTEVVATYQKAASVMERRAQQVMGQAEDSKRHAESAADLALGLKVLIETGISLGADSDLVSLLAKQYGGIYRVAAEGLMGTTLSRVGVSTIQALASALASGACHVTGPDIGLPVPAGVIVDGMDDLALNRRLGWTLPARADDAPRPGGARVGDLVMGPEDTPVIIFDPTTAFGVASRNPALVNSGIRQSQTWAGVWEEGLAAPYWARKRTGANNEGHTVRTSGVTGVPVALSTLLAVANGSWGVKDDQEE